MPPKNLTLRKFIIIYPSRYEILAKLTNTLLFDISKADIKHTNYYYDHDNNELENQIRPSFLFEIVNEFKSLLGYFFFYLLLYVI
jgi:hypothetical protein